MALELLASVATLRFPPLSYVLVEIPVSGLTN